MFLCDGTSLSDDKRGFQIPVTHKIFHKRNLDDAAPLEDARGWSFYWICGNEKGNHYALICQFYVREEPKRYVFGIWKDTKGAMQFSSKDPFLPVFWHSMMSSAQSKILKCL